MFHNITQQYLAWLNVIAPSHCRASAVTANLVQWSRANEMSSPNTN